VRVLSFWGRPQTSSGLSAGKLSAGKLVAGELDAGKLEAGKLARWTLVGRIPLVCCRPVAVPNGPELGDGRWARARVSDFRAEKSQLVVAILRSGEWRRRPHNGRP